MGANAQLRDGVELGIGQLIRGLLSLASEWRGLDLPT